MGLPAVRFSTVPKIPFFIICILIYSQNALSFYLPGVAPQDFQKGDSLNVKVNKLTSIKTQLPYPYYSLHFCQPIKIFDIRENLGEVLHGDRIENSPYVFKMRESEMCKVACTIVLDSKAAKEFKEKIEDAYRVNMILDNLPLVVPVSRSTQEGAPEYQLGFHVGLKGKHSDSKEAAKYFLHNHLSFTVKYHKDEQNDMLSRIVGFEVTPSSVKHEREGEWGNGKGLRLSTCDPHAQRTVSSSSSPQEVADGQEVIFTYSVTFQESGVMWASRWDTYLSMPDDQIHWFSIVNSLTIVLFLSGMVALIMLRTLYRDISKYNELAAQLEGAHREETGWRLVHADVFRPPTNSGLLCVHVGTGVQLLGTMLVTVAFAVLGFLSPSNRGGLTIAMLLLYAFMGVLAGYTSIRLYGTFKGTKWRKIALCTSVLFPGPAFCVFFALNKLVRAQKSSRAVPSGTVLALVSLWLGVSVPLVFLGGYAGFRKPALDDPVKKTNIIPRQIPEQPWYMNPALTVLVGGLLPFGVVFIELSFVLSSIWLNRFYYLFGFLFVVLSILAITCAEISVVLCYFQLCGEDYLWWWRSYLTSGSSALYLFLYATYYFFAKLDITRPVSVAMYFGYMSIASYVFFAMTGVIGFYACFWFTRLIYSSVKID